MFDFQIISTKKLNMIKQLHISEQSWFKGAEHCSLYLASMVAAALFIQTAPQFPFNIVTFIICASAKT